MDSRFLSVTRLAPAPHADLVGGPTDPNVAAATTPNAVLIASLPRSELDALLAGPPGAGVIKLFAPDPVSLTSTPASLATPPWFGAAAGGAQRELDRAHALKDSSLGRPQEAESKVEIGPAAVAHDLLKRARAAGLSEAEVARLDAILRASGDFKTDAALVAKLLDTRNAARGLRTFVDLAALREQYPKRITPDIVETLSMGVGRARSDASEGGEGILSPAQAHQAAMALAEMNSRDYEAICYGLFSASALFKTNSRADSETQRALILKAVAARRGEFSTTEVPASVAIFGPSKAAQEISRFAAQISNVDAAVLIERTSGIDLDGEGSDAALQQGWQNGSAAAVLQMARAEVDPIYAWNRHSDTHGDSPTGAAMVSQTMADAVSPSTGGSYVQRVVADSDERRAAAVDHIERLLEIGVDVPIAVTSPSGDSHAMLVTDVRGSGETREFLISDPWSGLTSWVACTDIIKGNVDGAGATLTSYWW